ncbi:MAG: biotin--[acetyl-CoA-carboxylase] ligase [Thermoanaerobaculia bacterium]
MNQQLVQYLSGYQRGRRRLSENLILLASTASTNSAARSFADHYLEQDLEPPPSVVLALDQTSGRGRRGRPWEGRPGKGIYMSILLSYRPVDRMEDLPVATAVGVCRAIREWVGTRCAIKWPNDLLVDGRKIAGILIESVIQGSRKFAVIGVGVNHSQTENELPVNAVSLDLVVAKPVALVSLGEAAGTVVRLVIEEIALMSRNRTATIDTYRKWTVHSVGESMRCSTVSGVQAGRFLGFDERGFLRLATSEGEITLSGGEIVEQEDCTSGELSVW